MKTNNLNTKDSKTGEIISLADGCVWLSGMEDVMYGELIEFGNGIFGIALNLEEDRVGAIVLGDYESLSSGTKVRTTGHLMEIGVSEEMLGRVVNAIGEPIDEMGKFKKLTPMPIEKIAPGIVDRKPVDTPLQTGIKAIDSMIPIGRGQRELIIGDRQVGKTAIAIDTIINQKNENVISIYVTIGQKRSKNAEVIKKLKEYGVFEKVIIVSASASDSFAMRYLAPYAGCAIGEYFLGKGKHALLVFDDLTKHAWAYREMSLLLKRPTGREAYPGDVFYLHSRLLERACQLSDKNGGGSLTALPIIETQAQDVSAYIPTNVISITDGQIYLESDLFFAGIKPALNVGLSVSRIGGAAQIKAMKKIAGRLRLDLAQFREMQAFAQFASDLDPATKQLIERGRRITEVLKQPPYSPVPLEEQVAALWAVTNGYMDEIEVEKVRDFEQKYLAYLKLKGKKMELEKVTKEFVRTYG